LPPPDNVSDGPGAIDLLAEFAASASAGGRAQRLALHLADAVLARGAGALCEEGIALQRLYARTSDGMLGRVAADAAITRLTEIDDIHRPTAVTVGALTAPVALAFTTVHTTVAQLFDALFAGQEVALRLGLALGGARLLSRGLWPSLLVAPAGAAVTAGRLLGLPPARMRQALALAIAQVPRAPGRFLGTRPGRWLLFGEAVRNGCMAALAAADGVDGDPALLDAAWLQAIGGDLADMAWLTTAQTPSDMLSIKPHASAKQALAGVHGLRRILAEEAIAPERVEVLELHVPPPYAAMLDRDPPRTSRLASLVSARWQLALAALRPELLDDVARTTWPQDARLESFASRVRVVPDPALDAMYPAAFPARLVVHAGARRIERLVSHGPGDPEMPFDAAQLLDKARRMPGASVEAVQTALRLPAEEAALARLLHQLGYAASGSVATRS
jgi:2-methylcitrate dehydratase PrpD